MLRESSLSETLTTEAQTLKSRKWQMNSSQTMCTEFLLLYSGYINAYYLFNLIM